MVMARNYRRLLLVALACSSAADASFQSLTSRSLEDNPEFQYALSDFSVKFKKCQYVKMYDDDLASNSYSTTVLALRHFVVFKLCPVDECSTCSDVHGEYVVDVADYLGATVEFEKNAFENMCASCNADECGELCYKIENLKANGYVDASAYTECQKIKNSGNTDDGEPDQLYIGPQCSSDGKNITIGLFTDQYCVVPFTAKGAEDVLGMKLSYHLLASTYSDSSSGCLSCKESDNNNNNNANDKADGDNVNEMCEKVYQSSAKCESEYGLTSGLVYNRKNGGQYENQVENEFMVCTFINSLVWNSYTESGEINYLAVQDEVIRRATSLQKGMLTLLTVSVVGFVLYASLLHHQIEKRISIPNMTHQAEGQLA